jgi:hypothetical protein
VAERCRDALRHGPSDKLAPQLPEREEKRTVPDRRPASDQPLEQRPGDALVDRASRSPATGGGLSPQKISNSGTVSIHLAPGLEHARAKVKTD